MKENSINGIKTKNNPPLVLTIMLCIIGPILIIALIWWIVWAGSGFPDLNKSIPVKYTSFQRRVQMTFNPFNEDWICNATHDQIVQKYGEFDIEPTKANNNGEYWGAYLIGENDSYDILYIIGFDGEGNVIEINPYYQTKGG